MALRPKKAPIPGPTPPASNMGARIAAGSTSHRPRKRPRDLRKLIISVQLLLRNVNRFRKVLVFKADRLVYHSTLGWRVIEKKKEVDIGKSITGSESL